MAGVKRDFASLQLDAQLLTTLGELGFTKPTPIQSSGIPILLAGRDLIGQAQTGSGKTAAFALPILQRIELEKRGVQALVLCPTRELSAQVAREVRKLGRRYAGLSVLEVVGGQPGRTQREALERGVHCVVGTPGRVLDHLQRGSLDASGLRTVVLDEADRMLDMGFGAEVTQILEALPSRRQTALFSATFPKQISEISRAHQHQAARITMEETADEVAEIDQHQLIVSLEDRFHGLCWVLDRYPNESAIVFCNLKATVTEVTLGLARGGVSVGRLDGSLDQFHRDQVLSRFRNQSLRVLVATDVAGRGIDVEGLDLVVNYEFPLQPEIYVHRIGRTGRAGERGVAVSLVQDPRDPRLEGAEALTGQPIKTLRRDQDKTRSSKQLLAALAKPPKMETILVSGGRKDKVRAGDLVGALTGQAGGMEGANVGKIEVRDRLSYVAVSNGHGRHATDRLNAGRIKGKKFRATLVETAEQPER